MEIEEKFLAAVEVINSIPYDGTFEPSEELAFKLYAYEKQATEGPCNASKPYIWNVSDRAKWNAWDSLGPMSKDLAMESYIEELSKVIETMSYNDKIAKFMSLMGPFYEVVTTDDVEKGKDISAVKSISSTVLENYNPPTILELYHMSRNVDQEKSSPFESDGADLSKHFLLPETSPESQSSSTSSSDISNFDLLSDLSATEETPPTERNMQSIFKNASGFKNCPFISEKDLLVLAVMNLQSSLEDVLRRLDNLHILAESSSLMKLQNSNDSLPCDSWSLNFIGTAFALLWPVAVDLYFNSFRK